MKTLTIFTPSYNRKHTIIRTFDSLCRQTSVDFEWLIIDDGSTDDTREWVESLGEKIVHSGKCFDWMGRPLSTTDDNHFVILPSNVFTDIPFRIEYVFKPNGGLYTGYNTAYAIIQTELCVCIDSDDYILPEYLSELLKAIKRNDSDIAVCGYGKVLIQENKTQPLLKILQKISLQVCSLS